MPDPRHPPEQTEQEKKQAEALFANIPRMSPEEYQRLRRRIREREKHA